MGSAKFHTSSILVMGYQKMKNFQESFVPIIDQKWAGQGFKCIHTGYLVPDTWYTIKFHNELRRFDPNDRVYFALGKACVLVLCAGEM